MKSAIKKQPRHAGEEESPVCSYGNTKREGELAHISQETNTYGSTFWNLKQVLLDFLAGEGKTHVIFQFFQAWVQN